MADTIEAFVEKLQKEGVEAGKAEARKHLAEVQAQAERILSEAKQQAERVVADARAEAEKILQQGRNELELAGRDGLLRLQEILSAALGDVLRRGAEAALKDHEFLTRLLHDVVVQYAGADARRTEPVEVRVNQESLEAVTRWALKEMTSGGDGPRSHVDLKGSLRTAGFEYRVDGGVVEVTPESVAGVLGEMVSPRLRELINQAAKAARK